MTVSPRLDSTVIIRQWLNQNLGNIKPRVFNLKKSLAEAKNTAQLVDTKVVISQNIVEVYYYENPIRINASHSKKTLKKSLVNRKYEYRCRSINKARNNIRRIAQANFNQNDKFLTLTLKNDNDFDIKNIKECDIKFRLFIRSLKRKYPNHKYVAVREFQKRGAVHYHLISNLPYIPKEELADIWGHGFVQINEVTNTHGIGAYISKYLSKDFEDPRFKGVKTYIASRNLTRPKIFYGEEAEKIFKEIIKPQDSPQYENQYKNGNGFVYFSEYNLISPIASEETINEIRNIFEKV